MDELFAGRHDAARPWIGRVLQRLFLGKSMTYKTYIYLQCRCRANVGIHLHYLHFPLRECRYVGLHDLDVAE
jgi:hypothetical protein